MDVPARHPRTRVLEVPAASRACTCHGEHPRQSLDVRFVVVKRQGAYQHQCDCQRDVQRTQLPHREECGEPTRVRAATCRWQEVADEQPRLPPPDDVRGATCAVTHATASPATTLNTRTTRHPSGVTSDWKSHTPSARVPITVCAAALSGRHAVPAIAARCRSAVRPPRRSDRARPERRVRGAWRSRRLLRGSQRGACGVLSCHSSKESPGRSPTAEVGPECKRARRGAGAFVNRHDIDRDSGAGARAVLASGERIRADHGPPSAV